jgi:hypothetical protein
MRRGSLAAGLLATALVAASPACGKYGPPVRGPAASAPPAEESSDAAADARGPAPAPEEREEQEGDR